MSLTGKPTHTVTQVSVEDDAHDEQIKVVWELERGAVAYDQHDLPATPWHHDEPHRAGLITHGA